MPPERTKRPGEKARIRVLATESVGGGKSAPISILQAKADDGYGSGLYALTAITGRTVETVELLFHSLTDANVWLRVAAADSLTKLSIGSDRMLNSLEEVLTETGKVAGQQEYWRARVAAGRGLVRSGPDGIRRVLSALRHDSPAVQRMAARSLDGVRGEILDETIAALRETLRGEDEDAAQQASSALFRLERRGK